MKFCVIGHPVGHSLSPEMHAANFRALGFDGTYESVDVPPERLADELKRLVSEGCRGINVTIPHKQAVMPLLDALDDSAVKYGAVNTIAVSEDGRTTGYNTDVDGFLADLAAHEATVKGKTVLICGAGGLGKALAVGCLEAGARDVTLANRTPRAGVLTFDSPICRELATRVDVLVNATALGLDRHDPAVLPPDCFKASQFVYDCAPVKHNTNTIRHAFIARARFADGLGMLVRQGALAFRIWTGLDADIDAMSAAVKKETVLDS